LGIGQLHDKFIKVRLVLYENELALITSSVSWKASAACEMVIATCSLSTPESSSTFKGTRLGGGSLARGMEGDVGRGTEDNMPA
jgi:hypothetical protein